MIKYAELVDYIKRNHVNWYTDLFDVLRGFFEEYSRHDYSPPPTLSIPPVQQEFIFPFEEDENGNYQIGVLEKDIPNYINWLNAHHFDYRGLIERGLALEAPEGMYKK